MLAGEGQRLVELASPRREALAGAGVDQVEREPRKSRAGLLDRGDRLVAVMGAAQEAQRLGVERLHAKRQPVNTCRRKGLETLGLSGIGVRLEGNFEIGQNGPIQPHPLKQLLNRLRRHQRRRAAAEKHRAYCTSGRKLGLALEVAHERLRPARRIDTVADVTIEVAVGAFRPAERPVNVDCERLSVH